MTHWSRRSTFVNHLAVAQKAAGEAFCKWRHVWASCLAPSRNSWASCGIRGSIWLLFFLICCGWCRHVASNAAMNLRKRIHRYNLRCVPRPRNKTMLSWRHKVFLRHFLVDASAATACLASFTPFYMAGKSFENLPLLFLLNLYLNFIYVTIQGALDKLVAWIKSLQVLLRQLLCLKFWPCVFQFNIEKIKISSNSGQLSKVTQYPPWQRGNLMNVFTEMKQKVCACELEQAAAASGKRGGLSSQQTI